MATFIDPTGAELVCNVEPVFDLLCDLGVPIPDPGVDTLSSQWCELAADGLTSVLAGDQIIQVEVCEPDGMVRVHLRTGVAECLRPVLTVHQDGVLDELRGRAHRDATLYSVVAGMGGTALPHRRSSLETSWQEVLVLLLGACTLGAASDGLTYSA